MIGSMLFVLGAVAGALAAILAFRPLSFAAQRPAEYAGTAPALDPSRHLSGALTVDGVIFGPFGRVTSRFNADMQGSWDGAAGHLAESFRFAGGGRQERAWHLQLGEAGRVTATAEDVIGTATGQASGATLVLRYRLRLGEAAGGHVLSVTDWMYLTEEGTIVNRSEMHKFGLPVATLLATMRPAGDV